MSWNVFYSYSHKDKSLRDQLATYLAPLKQKGLIVEWHDRKIQPGADWNREIASRIESADLVIMLLSPDFLASEYCFGVEMEAAFARTKSDDLKLAPVLMRPCLWERLQVQRIADNTKRREAGNWIAAGRRSVKGRRARDLRHCFAGKAEVGAQTGFRGDAEGDAGIISRSRSHSNSRICEAVRED